jgi:hypothetical protein
MYYDDKTCVICCEKFNTKEEHDKHYSKCADENIKTKYSKEEVFEIVYYEDAY